MFVNFAVDYSITYKSWTNIVQAKRREAGSFHRVRMWDQYFFNSSVKSLNLCAQRFIFLLLLK